MSVNRTIALFTAQSTYPVYTWSTLTLCAEEVQVEKQSDSRFLHRRHNQQVFSSNQRAAMFGLDARIALAIFGGLSIITGAALFSAISQTKATAIIAELNEVLKATSEYMLDTQTNLPLEPATISFQLTELISSSKPGWNGPYMPWEASEFQHPINPGAFIYRPRGRLELPRRNDDGSSDCPSTTDCYYWARMYDIDSLSLVEKIDEMVDGGDGASNGRLVWHYTGPYAVSLKGPAILR